ncbi:MAG: alpha/beta hydrolase [Acidimicrobiia bacterium]|nr:alpha/beta hydrolase [Acidimicrobiia bacterium]
MSTATLHDGATIDVEISGTGPAVVMALNPVPVEGTQADEMRRWGVDPALGRNLIDGLADRHQVIAADYEGHVLAHPKPDTLTPDNISADLLAIADASGASRFVYYGYSWLALAGLQLALRTDRLEGLAMGGYPPIGGPYPEMLAVTRATHELSTTEQKPAEAPDPHAELDWDTAEVTMTEPQTRQFVTLYEELDGFDDRAVQKGLSHPRLCFAGSSDRIEYGPRWGNVVVDIAGPLLNNRSELEDAGWQVRILDGLDHVQAMQAANVLPVLRPWLEAIR